MSGQRKRRPKKRLSRQGKRARGKIRRKGVKRVRASELQKSATEWTLRPSLETSEGAESVAGRARSRW